jgi:hypothetical protein
MIITTLENERTKRDNLFLPANQPIIPLNNQ